MQFQHSYGAKILSFLTIYNDFAVHFLGKMLKLQKKLKNFGVNFDFLEEINDFTERLKIDPVTPEITIVIEKSWFAPGFIS